MRPKVEVEATELNRLLSTLLERSLYSQNTVQLQAAHHLLGSIVNKRTTGEIIFYLKRSQRANSI